VSSEICRVRNRLLMVLLNNIICRLIQNKKINKIYGTGLNGSATVGTGEKNTTNTYDVGLRVLSTTGSNNNNYNSVRLYLFTFLFGMYLLFTKNQVLTPRNANPKKKVYRRGRVCGVLSCRITRAFATT